jgi:hypothetical protein
LYNIFVKICHACGQEIEIPEKVSREEICPKCRAGLHCCLNCSFFDEYAQNRCREPMAEWVSDREKGNFCEYFTFQDTGGGAQAARARDEARERLESLFKKKS